MKAAASNGQRILWVKALVNSLIIQVVGMLLFLVPGFVLAMKMGFQLGQELKDSAEVSRRISEAVSEMYQTSTMLMALYIVMMFLLIVLRSFRVARGTGERRILNGLLVGSVPVAVTLLSVAMMGFEPLTLVELLAYIVAGAVGGRLSRGEKATPAEASP